MTDIIIDRDAPRLDLLPADATKHARAMELGLWQCPQCPDGWMQYMIQIDMNQCPVCGYAGGPINGGKPQSESIDEPSDPVHPGTS